MNAVARGVPMIEIHEKHWLVWAHRARAPVARLGYPSPWPDIPSQRDPTVFDLYEVTPEDVDLADLIGLGVEALRREDPRRHAAVLARYLAPAESVRQATLARRWELTQGRVSQLATEGQRWVESWVEVRLDV